MKFKFDVFAEQAIHLDFFGLKVISSITFDTRITGLPPYRNTKKLTKPLLQVASQKKLKRGYWVHFSLENGCTVDCIWSRAIP
jgi:hypothetical protein